MENLGDCPIRPTRSNNSKRITVLSEAEKQALYDLPDFDNFRVEYFTMTEAEHALIFRRKDISAQIYAWQRYKQLSDNLVDALNYQMKKLEDDTKEISEKQFSQSQAHKLLNSVQN